MVLLVPVPGSRRRCGLRGKRQAVEGGRGLGVGRVRGEGLGVVEGQRARVQVREPPGGDRGRRLVVGGEVGYPRRGRGRGRGQGGAGGRVVGRQEEVEAAGVEGGEAPGPHHQHVLGVVVEGGDAGRHADGEGQPGHAGGGWGGGSGGIGGGGGEAR